MEIVSNKFVFENECLLVVSCVVFICKFVVL